MSVAELKLKVHELVDKQVNEKKLHEILSLLKHEEFRTVSAEEVVAEMTGRYDETFRKLAQ